MSSKNLFILAFLVLLAAAFACNMPSQNNVPPTTAPTTAPITAPTTDTTKVALELEATIRAKVLTEAATNQPPSQTPQPPAPPTNTSQPAASAPTETATTQPAGADMQTRIKNAKILIYEDAGAYYKLDLWVRATLDLMGLKYIHVGDAIGDFMSQLNSSTRWDLIIVAAESRKGVQGEFWDVITPKVTSDKTALIVEMWYLSQIANGRIQSLTSKCGISYQHTRSYVDSIYTLDTSNPIFSTPNGGFSLTNYVGYWKDKGGDYVKLTGSGDATLIAGGFLQEKSRYGLLTSCIDGRVIFQTFSTHDYHRETMQMLWENYITNTLTNHFKAIQ